MMEINFDLNPFLGAFQGVPDAVRRELRKTIKQETTEVMKLSRNVHRHKRKTGSLNNSIKETFEDDKLTGVVGFDPGVSVVGKPDKKVNYGKYVHEGHGSWAPDQFLYEALAKREPMIISALEDAVRRGIRAAGA